MYDKTPEIKAIHAGLECGLLGGVYPNWDMISWTNHSFPSLSRTKSKNRYSSDVLGFLIGDP